MLRVMLGRFVLLVAAAAALAACGGGRAGVPPMSGSVGKSAPQSVTIRIDVPKSAGASNRRHPQFISPATTQMRVDVQSGCPGACSSISGYPVTVGLTPTSTGCSSTLATTACEVSISLAPGTYVASFTALDAAGKTLSAASNVPATIVAGTSNTLAVTLSGVPAQLGATIAATGGATTHVLAYALDADGNFIVGPGAPAFSAAQSGAVVGLTQPSAASPNMFGVTPTAGGTTQLTLTASYAGVTDACASPFSGACSSTISLLTTDNSRLFVADPNTNQIQQYAPPFDYASPIFTLNTGGEGAYVNNVALDASGDVFTAFDDSDTTFAEYAPDSQSVLALSSQGVSGIAVDPNGDLLDTWGGHLSIFPPPFTGAPTVTNTNVVGAYGMAFDAAGDLFYGSQSNDTIQELAPPYTGSPITVISAGVPNPRGIAMMPNGNLFVATSSGVSAFAPPYTGGPFAQIAASNLDGVAVTPSGDLFFAVTTGSSIPEYAPPYTGSPIATISNGVTYPAGLAYQTAFSVTISQ